MDTRWAKRNVATYIDGEMDAPSQWVMRRRLINSPELYEQYESSESEQSLTALMRHLAAPPPPADLSTRIKVVVSHESSPGFWTRLKIRLDDLMRPLAVPAAGGFLAAVCSFVVLMSSVGISPRMFAEDVPLAFFDKAFIANPEMSVPTRFTVTEETVVLAFIDGEGSVYDFRVISDHTGAPTRKVAAELATALVTTRFEPAMNFGRPVLGTMLITFRPGDRVEVRG